MRRLWSYTDTRFNVLLTEHLSITLVNDQLDAQLFYFIIRLLQSGKQVERELSTCIPNGHLQKVTIPDAVLIQFDLLMMSTTLLETCIGL